METLFGIEFTHHDEETMIGNDLFTSCEKAEKFLIELGYESKINSRDEIFYEKDCYWMYANIRNYNLVE